MVHRHSVVIAGSRSDTRQRRSTGAAKNRHTMPVAQGPRFDLRNAALIGGIALVVAFGIGLTAIVLAQNSGNIEVRLGDDTFRSLNAQAMADQIAEDGPILFGDVAGGSRDIYLSHEGADPATGWSAFEARVAGTDRGCNVIWIAETRRFDDPCASGVDYPPDGTGLDQIPVVVEDGDLIIDINRVLPATEDR